LARRAHRSEPRVHDAAAAHLPVPRRVHGLGRRGPVRGPGPRLPGGLRRCLPRGGVMTWTAVADVLGLALVVAGALLCLSAAIGLLRFPDLLTRMHAATKPQALGVLLVLIGVGLRTRLGLDVGMLILIGAFQLLTIPV